jgi:hypothetical protein
MNHRRQRLRRDRHRGAVRRFVEALAASGMGIIVRIAFIEFTVPAPSADSWKR